VDTRAVDRARVLNRAYLFRRSFPQTARARIAFARLLMLMRAHRTINREWSRLHGLSEGIVHRHRARGRDCPTG
jgi:hypothetical protein